mmetsp:Transcript_25841/g.43090  ORF Transcript_25841/g.43090 Transcript_25841/m.43090 type:complete len:202 (-) Transcript_25841:949-1554(-)
MRNFVPAYVILGFSSAISSSRLYFIVDSAESTPPNMACPAPTPTAKSLKKVSFESTHSRRSLVATSIGHPGTRRAFRTISNACDTLTNLFNCNLTLLWGMVWLYCSRLSIWANRVASKGICRLQEVSPPMPLRLYVIEPPPADLRSYIVSSTFVRHAFVFVTSASENVLSIEINSISCHSAPSSSTVSPPSRGTAADPSCA